MRAYRRWGSAEAAEVARLYRENRSPKEIEPALKAIGYELLRDDQGEKQATIRMRMAPGVG